MQHISLQRARIYVLCFCFYEALSWAQWVAYCQVLAWWLYVAPCFDRELILVISYVLFMCDGSQFIGFVKLEIWSTTWQIILKKWYFIQQKIIRKDKLNDILSKQEVFT